MGGLIVTPTECITRHTNGGRGLSISFLHAHPLRILSQLDGTCSPLYLVSRVAMLFCLGSLSIFRAARSNPRLTNQVPALRAGVVSASRPRQAGMVIGVVPRYDPHGMGMPLMSHPGGGSSGGDVPPAMGRQRAATASSLEQQREVCWCCISCGRYCSR